MGSGPNLVIGFIMPVLVFTILSYTCYQYIFNVNEFRLDNDGLWTVGKHGSVKKVISALFLCSCSCISYIAIMFHPAAFLPQKKDDSTETGSFPSVYNTLNTATTGVAALSLCSEQGGKPLYCYKCKSNKPERAHHCRECDRCVPKMDHHCVWINGCVDEGNYKFFFLFVVYVATYSILVALTVSSLISAEVEKQITKYTLDFFWKVYMSYLQSIYYFWKNLMTVVWHRKWIHLLTGVDGIGIKGISFHWCAITFLGFMFGITLTGFTLVHGYYILSNLTSIEKAASKKPIYVRVDFDKTGQNFEVVHVINKKNHMYNRGTYSNWCAVMGSNPLLWFVPIKTSGNGAQGKIDKCYPYNEQFAKDVVKSAKAQRENRERNNDSSI